MQLVGDFFPVLLTAPENLPLICTFLADDLQNSSGLAAPIFFERDNRSSLALRDQYFTRPTLAGRSRLDPYLVWRVRVVQQLQVVTVFIVVCNR